MTKAAAAICVLLITTPAHAMNPPAPGTLQYQLLAPFRDWVEHAAGQLGLCCSLGDGRVVATLPKDGHWMVKFDKEDGFPVGWVEVADEALLRIPNPTGMAVAWWYGGRVRCLALPGGV